MSDKPSESITIEVYRTPPPYFKGNADDIGYLRAFNDEASVTLACSLELIDDRKLRDSYIANKLLLFHRMEAEHMGLSERQRLLEENR